MKIVNANDRDKKITFHDLKLGDVFESPIRGGNDLWMKICDDHLKNAVTLDSGVSGLFHHEDVVHLIDGEFVVKGRQS